MNIYIFTDQYIQRYIDINKYIQRIVCVRQRCSALEYTYNVHTIQCVCDDAFIRFPTHINTSEVIQSVSPSLPHSLSLSLSHTHTHTHI